MGAEEGHRIRIGRGAAMLAGDIEAEVRHGIDDISKRGMRMSDGGGRRRGGPAGALAGGGGEVGGWQGIDLFSLLLAWLDSLAGLAGALMALLRRI